jgi:hypothetical protein
VAVAGWPAAAWGQIPEGWEVVRVTNDSFYDGPPAINCMGQIVWSKRINNQFDREEIFLYDIDGTVRQITDDNVRDAFPDINDDGVIVWSREVGPGGHFEVARYEDGEITILTDNEHSEYAPQINNTAHIVWNEVRDENCTPSDIFFYDGKRAERVVQDGFSNQAVSLNDLDEMVWTRYDFCQNPWRGTPMYRKANGEIIELTDGTDQNQGVHINNEPQIVWGAKPDGVAYWENGQGWLLTDWGRAAGINERGLVSIYRWHEDIEAWQQWLWIDGRMIRISEEPYWNHSGQLNNSGEVAWQGRTGARLADSQIVLLTWQKQNADIDGSGVTSLEDFELFADCLAGPGETTEGCVCHRCDLDHDGSVDLKDFVHLQQVLRREP